MKKKKVTMTDIAAAAGVSQPTVSVILNGSTTIKIAEETRQRVLNIAQGLGYQHRQLLHGENRHRKLAFLVNALDMHDPFINAISAAQEAAWNSDTLMVTFHYGESAEMEQAFLHEIESLGFAGIIYARTMTQTLEQVPLQTSLPLVLLNCSLPMATRDIPAVVPANYLGAYQVTVHLLEQGYQRIAMINGEPWAEPSVQREQGFRDALSQKNRLIPETWIRPGNWSVKQSYKQALWLLQQNPRPDAIFCASDLMALGCYQAIHEMGLSIPQQIAVAGYDNQIMAAELTPSLTTIDLPYDEMGRLAVDMVLNNIQSLGLQKVEGELHLRASSQAMLSQVEA